MPQPNHDADPPIVAFSAQIGGYDAQFYKVTLLDSGHVEYLYSPHGFTEPKGTRREILEITPAQLARFKRTIWQELGERRWANRYEQDAIHDGTFWSVSWEDRHGGVSYSHRSSGNNAYPEPESFLKLKKAVSELVGGRAFE